MRDEPDLDPMGLARPAAAGREVTELGRRERLDRRQPKKAQASRAPITTIAAIRKIRSPRLILPGCMALKPMALPLRDPVLAEGRDRGLDLALHGRRIDRERRPHGGDVFERLLQT